MAFCNLKSDPGGITLNQQGVGGEGVQKKEKRLTGKRDCSDRLELILYAGLRVVSDLDWLRGTWTEGCKLALHCKPVGCQCLVNI